MIIVDKAFSFMYSILYTLTFVIRDLPMILTEAYSKFMVITFVDVFGSYQFQGGAIVTSLIFSTMYIILYRMDDLKLFCNKIEEAVILMLSKVAEAVVAVWIVIKNPFNLLGFITVFNLANNFPHLVRDMAAVLLKGQKVGGN